MTDPAAMAAAVVLGAAVVVAVAASWSALRPRTVYARLHYPGMLASVTGPLLTLAVLLDYGLGLTTAIVALTAALLWFTAPVSSAAIGKLNVVLGERKRE
ncbi:monovalent cation/H(+) antiporter subunit G [Nocardia africana]|uniref:Putative monovalent cation/H+ antiporter subunit G n=1 Tax=Nocardia africana TaxID=134964 RepID=A0A378WT71_9NOCA|nr:monovalent cation/H(+) antiporter subunit G [Nocardia africana]MCC3314212.1 monovalent cation/H(+) antiporter subunit G [Nocardia africana]SUA43533.1 putative monovalent cation/H+ antiporter subunit G [Nocardia africana]